jgi:spermidine synthase
VTHHSPVTKQEAATMRRLGLYGLFFISGVSALIYELVWQRLLNLVFGVSTLSVSAVLAAFMGGLALGGLLCGRHADRAKRPLRLYAWLEAGIGIASLLVPPGFAALTTIYPIIYDMLHPGAWGGACLRLVMSLLVLSVPATLLGATLPVMGRLTLGRTSELPTAFSLFYAVNTMGAVMGAALTGFLFLRYLGMQHTLWLAGGLNLVAALGAYGLAAVAPRSHAPRGNASQDALRPVQPRGMTQSVSDVGSHAERGNEGKQTPWLALTCAALTGAVCTGLEVAWSRILGILTSNSAYGFALLLTVMLLGLALGSLLQSWWSRRPGDSWRRLALCQLLLAAVTLGSLSFFRMTPEWLARWCEGTSAGKIFLGEFALTATALLAPAIFMGMSLPLLVAGVTNDPSRFGHWLGRLYAINTLGGVIGPFAAGFILIPALGIRVTLGICVVVTLVVCLTAWAWTLRPSPSWRCVTAAAVLVIAAAAWDGLPPGGYHKSVIAEPRHLLSYAEGNNATVAVVAEPDGSRSIMVDSQPVAGTGATITVDQKMLAHLPLLLHPNPRSALTVGFGSGGTSHSMTLHGIAVDCVEIEGRVPAAADLFQSENHGVLSHPKFHLVLDDARSWLRVAPHHYDVIVTDCTNIQYRSNGDLYTVDYFRLMKERLRTNGLAAAWVPANGIRGDDLKTLLRSFRQVFPHTSVWYMNTLPTDFLIVVGTPGKLSIDMEKLRERMHAPNIYPDLAAVDLAEPSRLVYTLLTAEDKLSEYLGKGPLNTDDRPVLSYSTYGANYRSTIAGNLVDLLACRVDASRYVKNREATSTMLTSLAATNEALMGHVAHLAGDERTALAHYVKGAQLLPYDTALRRMVLAASSSLGTSVAPEPAAGPVPQRPVAPRPSARSPLANPPLSPMPLPWEESLK